MKEAIVLPFRRKKCKKLEEEYIEGALNYLAQAQYLSGSIKDNPMMLTFVKASIRGIFHCLNGTDTTLANIGTSIEELKDLIAPPEHGLSKEKRNKRWNWVLDKNKNEKTSESDD